MDTKLTIQLEADDDGFISQECPDCHGRFKVNHGKGSDQPIRFCPYCKHHGEGCWWTQAQADYLADVATTEFIDPMLDDIFKDINRAGQGGSVSVTAKHDHSPPPQRPPEMNDDWSVREFACCSERIKHDGSKEQLHCIICGQEHGKQDGTPSSSGA